MKYVYFYSPLFKKEAIKNDFTLRNFAYKMQWKSYLEPILNIYQKKYQYHGKVQIVKFLIIIYSISLLLPLSQVHIFFSALFSSSS